MWSIVSNAFRGTLNLKDINQTLNVLIPKCDKPEFFNQFRPISLCSVIYKCITKIIVNWLKNFLPTIVAPNQDSFVLGRLIHDNIMIT